MKGEKDEDEEEDERNKAVDLVMGIREKGQGK